MEYVLGFAFYDNEVYLIRKLKTKYQQEEKLNGIGGKIEFKEPALDAIVREFEQKTTAYISHEKWKRFAALHSEDRIVSCYFTFITSMHIKKKLKHYHVNHGKEICQWINIKDINNLNVMSQLHYIIPLAFYAESNLKKPIQFKYE